MRALLLSLTLLLAITPAAAAQGELGRAVDGLREDPIYVDPDADGVLTAGEVEELRAFMEERLEPGELFVAITPAIRDMNGEDVALHLSNVVPIDTSVAVIVGTEFGVLGATEAHGAAGTAAFEAHQQEGAAAVLIDTVDRIAAIEPQGDDDGGFSIGVGGVILLGVVGASGAAALVAARRRRRERAAEFAEVKDNARDDLVALGDDIRALEIDMDMPGASAEAKRDYETAVGAYERADQRWRLAQRPDDLEPVGSALEEGRWAMGSARARLEDREPPERRAPCFFDPRHGPSTRDVEWSPYNGVPRMVPACEADAQTVERGEEPQAREVTVGGQRMPYWSAGPAYAPFMGGFYGAGILPGLVVGTMLGDVWSDPGAGDAGGGDFGGGDFGGGDFGGGDFGGG